MLSLLERRLREFSASDYALSAQRGEVLLITQNSVFCLFLFLFWVASSDWLCHSVIVEIAERKRDQSHHQAGQQARTTRYHGTSLS
jgi:hypothetical protein